MIATLRREIRRSVDSSEDATSFIASLLLSRDGQKRPGSGEWRRVPFTGQRVGLRSIEAHSQVERTTIIRLARRRGIEHT
jgi:hypothetical protein